MTGTYAPAALAVPVGFDNWTSAAAKRAFAHTPVTRLEAVQEFETSLARCEHSVVFSGFFQSFSEENHKHFLPVLFAKYGKGHQRQNMPENEAIGV